MLNDRILWNTFSVNKLLNKSSYINTIALIFLHDRYIFSLITSSIRVLSVSQKTSIRINEQGLLCIQFMIPTTNKDPVFVDYTVRIAFFCLSS